MSDVPEGLPQGWSTTTLREISEIVGGVTKDAKKTAIQGMREVPYLRVANVQRGRLDLTEVKAIAASEADIEKLTLQRGDILLNEGGDRDKLGRGWIWEGQLPVCIHQNHVFRARLFSSDIEPLYIAHFANSAAQSYFFQQGSQTTNLASISLTKLGSLPVWLPPSKEQARIVAKLDEVLSDLDVGLSELDVARKKLQRYRQSLLMAAVEGKLTADWRADHPPAETGDELLRRILVERRARWEAAQRSTAIASGKTLPPGWQARYSEPLAAVTDDLPALPHGWAWATIDQLARVGTGSTPLRSRKDYFEPGTVPWVTSGALNSELVLEASECVSDIALAECRLEVYPVGTLLVAMYGEGKTRGKCAELGIEAATNQAIAAIVLDGTASECREQLKTHLLHSYVRMREYASGGVQPNLNLQIIKALPVALPPLCEQRQIQRLLRAQQTALTELESAISIAHAQATAQRQNILRAAFSGQLVPQDPADEPADSLLARIRAGRSGTKPPVRRKRAASPSVAVS